MDDDDDTTTTVSDDDSGDEQLSYDEDSENIAADLSTTPAGQKYLSELSKTCLDRFDSAWESTEQWREKTAKNWRLFAGELPPKQPPFENVPNPHVPIMLTNLARITARAQDELFRDWSNVMTVVPVGPDDKEIPLLLSQHGNWQIRQKITDFKRQMYRGLMLFFVNGDVAGHSYYDPVRRRNCHEILTCDEFVIPYIYTTTEPDYSDVPFKCKVLRRYRHELERYADIWLDVDKVLDRQPPSWDDSPEPRMRNELASVQGEDIPDDIKNAPYKLIWYEGYYCLPGDDRERCIKTVIDTTTRRVLLLLVHEQEDWQDKIRHERQSAELAAYQQAVMAHDQSAAMSAQQEQMLRQQVAQPGVDPVEAQMLIEALDASTPPAPPPTPQWMADGQSEPDPIRKVPIQMFSHGVNIEPIVGSLGIGLGAVLADFNRAANVALSQFADAADFNNARCFITTGLEFEGGPPKIFPGAHLKVSQMNGTELDKAIKEFQVGPASPQLMQLVQACVQYGHEVMQAPDVLSGESGKSGETYRGLAARIEQATKQLSVTTRKYADFLENVLVNNGKLNAVYLDDDEFFYVNDHLSGTSQELRVGRKLYERDYRVEIRSDLRFTTQAQRISEADEALQLPQIIPPLASNIAYWWHATKKALEARGLNDLVAQLGPEPPSPTTPLGVPPPQPPMMQGGPPAEVARPTNGGGARHPGPQAAQGGAPPVGLQGGAPPPAIQQVSDHGGAQAPKAP